ncbi:P-loop ATPase, Sll1717 family [uncultured Stenotrophomonas sp.]|uniref:P-loop ATPase, Sll1717 family n=1 Tax=uncultured Stenotrophomonas sp. TaxID=165438 RepID=UPI0025F79E8F|nr:hypothetical protein [uncultured Stenotrophomonas sp.]
MSLDFDTFTQGMGFAKYPFSVFTAEEEKEFLSAAFVRPLAYSTAVDAAKSRKNIFLYGERGTGKTALLFELVKACDPSSTVAEITDFSEVPVIPSQSDVCSLYISTLATAIIKRLLPTISDFRRPYKLTRQEKTLLSYLLQHHTSVLSRNALMEDLRQVQHHPAKRLMVSTFNFFRGLINSAAGAAVDLLSETVSKSLGLPQPAAGGAREYLQAVELKIDGALDESKANLVILKQTIALCGKVGMRKITIVIDRVDEDSRLRNDSELIATFLRPFLAENDIFYIQDLHFLFSIWSVPFQKVKPDFRANKFCVEQVCWEPKELLMVLDKRLEHHSEGNVVSHESILECNVFFRDKVLPLANSNPRDLWQLMHQIIREQFALDRTSTIISTRAMENGIRRFVRGFTYYEYYPRRKDARANSSDVYSYIAHLNKLDSVEFTTNSLSAAAGTGSSTPNYIVGMEGMGLVRRCEDKGPNGSTLYEIRDPKVRFAVENNIEIRRDA